MAKKTWDEVESERIKTTNSQKPTLQNWQQVEMRRGVDVTSPSSNYTMEYLKQREDLDKQAQIKAQQEAIQAQKNKQALERKAAILKNSPSQVGAMNKNYMKPTNLMNKPSDYTVAKAEADMIRGRTNAVNGDSLKKFKGALGIYGYKTDGLTDAEIKSFVSTFEKDPVKGIQDYQAFMPELEARRTQNKGFFARNVQAGINQFRSGMMDLSSNIAEALGFKNRSIGFDAERQAARTQMNTANQVNESQGGGVKFAGNVVQGVTQALPGMAMAGLGGTVAGLATFGLPAAGNYMGEAESEGASIGKRLAYGAVGGVAEAGLERALGMFGLQADEAIKPLLKATLKENLKTIGKTYAKNAAGEGLEEVIANIGMTAAKKAIYDADAKFDLKGALYEGLVGAAAGGVMQTPAVMQYGAEAKFVSDKIQNEYPETLIAALSLPKESMSNKLAQKFVNEQYNINFQELQDFQEVVKSDLDMYKAQNVRSDNSKFKADRESMFSEKMAQKEFEKAQAQRPSLGRGRKLQQNMPETQVAQEQPTESTEQSTTQEPVKQPNQPSNLDSEEFLEIPVYHGTWRKHKGFNSDSDFYFTPDKEFAKSFIREPKEGTDLGGELLEGKIKKNAKILDTRTDEGNKIAKEIIENDYYMNYKGIDDYLSNKFENGLPKFTADDFIYEAKQRGYDAIVLAETLGKEGTVSFRFFNPNVIKEKVIESQYDNQQNTSSQATESPTVNEHVQTINTSSEQINASQSELVQKTATQEEPTVSEEVKNESDKPYSVEQTKHTKTNAAIWVAKPKERLTKEQFDAINAKVKANGGYYTGFVKGFVFKSEPSADVLDAIFSGEAQSKPSLVKKSEPQKAEAKEPKKEVSAEEKQKSKADKLRTIADGMQNQIDDKFRGRNTNTARRANMAAGAYAEGEALQRKQAIMRAIADDIENGTAKRAIAGFTTKADVEMAHKFTSWAVSDFVNSELRAKFGNNYSSLDKDKIEITKDAANFAKMPSTSGERLQYYLRDFENKEGFKRDVARILKQHDKKDTVYFHMYPDVVALLEKAVKIKDGYMFKETLADFRRLEKLGITTKEGLQQLVFDYLPYYQNKVDSAGKKERELRLKEQEVARMKIEGFFPTPKTIVKQMLELADIQEGEKVLEPSAGAGSIADEIGVGKVDVVEWNSSLNQILKDKGHNVIGSDVFEVKGKYDKIVMNPPFEKMADVDHVMKVFNENLKPGGRIVAIMSESPFFRNDKKASDFRLWLEEYGYSEKLPEGSFKESDRQTGVNTRLVVIDKPSKPEGKDTLSSPQDLMGLPSPSGKNTDAKGTMKASELISEMIKEFDIALHNRIRGKKALGTYDRQTYAIRLMKANDLQTFSHEAGHHIDNAFEISKNSTGKASAQLLELGEYTSKKNWPISRKKREGLAEFIRHYLTDKDATIKQYPELTAYFKSKVDDKTMSFMDKWAKQTWGLYNLGAVDRVKKSIQFMDEKPRKQFMSIPDFKFMANVFYEGVFDQTHMIEYFSGKMGGQKAKELLSRKLAKFRGYEAVATADIYYGQTDLYGKDTGKSYQEIMKPVHVNEDTRKDFMAYQVARRSEDYFKRGLELPDTLETYQSTVKELEAKYPFFKSVFNDLFMYRVKMLGILKQAGIYNQEQLAKMVEENPNYAPLKRVVGDTKTSLGTGRALGSGKKVIKGLRGGGQDIIDPEQSDIANTFTYRSVAMRNDILRTLADIADKTEGFGNVMAKAELKSKLTQFSAESIQKQLEDLGVDPSGLDPEAMLRIFKPDYLAGENQVVVYRNGKPEIYDINPYLYKSISGLSPELGGKVIETLAAVANLQKMGVVVTPQFVARNLARDTVHSMITSNAGINPIDMLSGFISVVTKDETFQKAMKSGGYSDYFVNDQNHIRKITKDIMKGESKAKAALAMANPLEAIRWLSDVSEFTSRTAEFKKVLKKQGNSQADVERAVESMRNLSVDFKMMGRWVKKTQWNRIDNFFNAQLQGFKNTAAVSIKHPFRTTIRAFTLVTLPTLFLMYLNRDNEYYKELPQWRRDFFWNIPVGDPKSTNVFFMIPKPFEFGLVFGAIPERMVNDIYGKDKHAWNGVMKAISDTIVPDFMPSALNPILEDMTNKTWSGRPILSEGDKRVIPEEQYNEYTSEVAKGIARLTKDLPVPDAIKSPKRIQHLIEGYTTTVGRVALTSIDQMTGAKTGVPIIGGAANQFTTDALRSPESVSRFYDNKSKMDIAYSTAKRNGVKLSNEMTALRKQYNEINEKMTDMNDMKKQLESGKPIKGYEGMTDEKRKLYIIAINKEIIELTQYVNKLFDKYYTEK